jgi:hypothetical protein
MPVARRSAWRSSSGGRVLPDRAGFRPPGPNRLATERPVVYGDTLADPGARSPERERSTGMPAGHDAQLTQPEKTALHVLSRRICIREARSQRAASNRAVLPPEARAAAGARWHLLAHRTRRLTDSEEGRRRTFRHDATGLRIRNGRRGSAVSSGAATCGSFREVPVRSAAGSPGMIGPDRGSAGYFGRSSLKVVPRSGGSSDSGNACLSRHQWADSSSRLPPQTSS